MPEPRPGHVILRRIRRARNARRYPLPPLSRSVMLRTVTRRLQRRRSERFIKQRRRRRAGIDDVAIAWDANDRPRQIIEEKAGGNERRTIVDQDDLAPERVAAHAADEPAVGADHGDDLIVAAP